MLRLYVEIYHRPQRFVIPIILGTQRKRLIGNKEKSSLAGKKKTYFFGECAERLYLLGYGVSPYNIPQRLKPESFNQLYRRSKDLLHPAVGHSKA